jgi:hypothetical protein
MRRLIVFTPLCLLIACGGGTPNTQPTVVVQPPHPLSSGAYTLTFIADPVCASLPVELRTRTYRTAIKGGVEWQLVTLSGALFAPPDPTNGYPGSEWNVISVQRVDNTATWYFEDPPIREVIAARGHLEIYGHVVGAITDPRTELPISGYFDFGGVTCRSANHKLVVVGPE